MVKKYHILNFVLVFYFLTLISADKNSIREKTLKINTPVSGKMEKNDSREFYNLVIPNNFEKKSVLVFTIKESRKGIKEGEEIFSDPDIYISKSLKYPKNGEEADWYSEKYGSDIVTIPSYAVEKGEKFYITLYCQFKCRYQLKAYLAKEVEIDLGNVYTVTLKNKYSMNYYLRIGKEDYSELNLVSYSPNGRGFKAFMSKTTPSSQNTFRAIPSWLGGYIINVNKKDKNYCKNCVYHILFQAQEEDTIIQFYTYFPNTITKVTSGNPIVDLVTKDSKRCYSFDMSKENKRDEELVIQSSLFTGSALIYISGWNIDLSKSINDVKNEKSTYIIDSERTILLKSEDLIGYSNNSHTQKMGFSETFYLCLYGIQKSSFNLKIYYLSEAPSLQRYNYLLPGTAITGFLHGNQVTSYTVVNSNLNKNSNITLSLKSLSGNTTLFGESSENIYSINKFSLERKKKDKNLLVGEETSFSKSEIVILAKNNRCFLDTSKNCKTVAYVQCHESENQICSYNILALFEDSPIFMSPKKTYFNVIPKDKKDIYEISVDEPSIKSIVIVLTSVAGDAQISVSKVKDRNKLRDSKNLQLIGFSTNSGDIPDVVRITPKKLNSDNIVGLYVVYVFSSTFSSYNLYYYPTRIKEKDEKPNLSDISVSLKEGNIIKDYFPNNIDYKIYSYTPDDKTKKDIKIALTRINVRFSFKVFLNFNKIKFNINVGSVYDEKLTGYDWASDSNSELTISKNDKKYSRKGPYYIVVIKDSTTDLENEDTNPDDLDNKAIISYYIGLTKTEIPFDLNEGIEHSLTLSSQYPVQCYWYNHYKLSDPFQLTINILIGEVDVFISTKRISSDNIEKLYNITYTDNNEYKPIEYNLNIGDYGTIKLTKDYFDKYCSNSALNPSPKEHEGCSLFIYVVQSQGSKKFQKDSQYLISAKSSISLGRMILSGKVYKGELAINSAEHFIIEEVKHREGSTINVKFNEGYGDIYVRVPEIPEQGKNISFPNETYYDYIADNCYLGKTVYIPAKIFDKINSRSRKVQILVTIIAKGNVPKLGKYVKYSISYSSEAKRINQNIPYSSYINSGEHHYYTFYFDKNTKNIYISLSNMIGDADMYLNHGNEIFPTVTEHDWASNKLGHEYIDIDKNDKYFIKHSLDDVSGYYTLLIIGYTNTTYTIFISSHDQKIVKIEDNFPANCKCENKNDKCFFRYDNIYDDRKQENSYNYTEVIFTTQYSYGNGKMYSSIYKDQEIYNDGKRKKYSDYFPDEENFDFSNKEKGKRNYMKVKVPENKYSKDTVIFLTFICQEKTDVEITTASLARNGVYKYLNVDRENMFYIKYNESVSKNKQIESILNYYSYKDEDLIYEFHVYLGSAKIKIYTNESSYNITTRKMEFEYNHIANLIVQSQVDENYDFRYPKTFSDNYLNYIPKSLIKGKTVMFSIFPLSDFGFYLQLLYDRSWINIPIGKDKPYLIRNNSMYGYFDIYSDYSSVEMSISLEDFTKKTAKVYVNLIVINKNAKEINPKNKEDKLYHYEIPSRQNNDYNAETDKYLGVININIDNIPTIKEEDKEKKIVRALFAIEISKIYYGTNTRTYRNYDLGFNNNFENKAFDSSSSLESTIHISITPGVNNIKRVDTSPYTYYFSNTSLLIKNKNSLSDSENNKSQNKAKEVKIYSLDKIKDSDTKMIIQINSCSGNYDIKLSSKIVDYNDNKNDIKYEKLSGYHGRKIYLLDNLQFKHIYLSVIPSEKQPNCKQGDKKCSNELSYLLYYYSASDKEYNSTEQNIRLSYRPGGKNELWIRVPRLNDFDHHKQHRDKENIEYNLFWTKNKTYYKYMESICYLSQLLNNEEINNADPNDNSTIHVVKNIQLNDRNEYLIYDIDPDKGTYLNILSRNLKTNELIAFTPIKGISQTGAILLRLAYFIVLAGVLILIIIIAVSFCRNKEAGVYSEESDNLKRGEIEKGNRYSSGEIQYSNISKTSY